MRAGAIRDVAARCARAARSVDAILYALPFAGPPDPAAVLAAMRGADVRSESVSLSGGGQLTVVFIETLIDRDRLWRELIDPLISGSATPATLPGATRLTTAAAVAGVVVPAALLLPRRGSAA